MREPARMTRDAILTFGLGLVALLLSNCNWNATQFFFHPPVAERMRDNLSGELRAPGPVAVDPDSFRFAMFGDLQVEENGSSLLGRFRRDVARRGIDFFCVLGDMTMDASESARRQVKAQLDSVGVPYYSTLGNHDLYQADGWKWFKTTFGPSCHTVVIGDRVKLLFLDTADGMLGQVQFDWLESELADSGRFVKIVATHYALFDGSEPIVYRLSSTEERNKLMNLFCRYRVHSIVSGHLHGWRHTLIQGTNHFIAAMPPRGMDYGNPTHVVFTWAHDSLSWEPVEYKPDLR